MTLAIAIKVNDGIILAADSASTIIGHNEETGEKGVWIIYDNANKVFNLVKGVPVGAITWGAGSIGQASTETLAKDFRRLITDDDPNWTINSDDYSIEDIANKFKHFIYNNHYVPEFKEWPKKPDIGFLIVGYSIKRPLPEVWQIDIENGKCHGPKKVAQEDDVGIHWFGEIEAIGRLYKGFSLGLGDVLEEAKLSPEKIQEVIDICNDRLIIPLATPPMPIQDAINLARFLVEMTEQFSKYTPGAPTVAGPIEIAAITKHEGFRWVERKHYYNKQLNSDMIGRK